jgi:uncharacterized protein (DUF2235 family)
MSDLNEMAKQPVAPNQSPDAPANWRMPNKKIVVCCDGTGNEFRAKAPAEKDTDGNSNVVKLYTALDLSLTQIAYYHPGVGTMGDPSKQGMARRWSKVKGLAFGWGFRENVLDAYRYLMQHYNAGDQVYIFGFSRGAYTARALAGFLHGYGLLCRGNEGHILYAWNLYTAKLEKQRAEAKPGPTLVTDFAFRDTFSHADFMMHFVGLWDTVSSVGWITTPLRLLHLAQNPSIVIGRHAISVDERRCFYHDNIWGDAVQIQIPPCLIDTPRGNALNQLQDLAQVWFPGVHSDVGGSYGQYASGLSNASLEWMMDQAAAGGAVFKAQRREAVLGEAVVDDPQGRTAALQCMYPRPTQSKIHKSLTWAWWFLEGFPHRYYNTDQDKKEILRVPWGAWRRLPDGAMLHTSLMEKEGGTYKYASPNLKCGERREVTEGDWKGYGVFAAPARKPGWRQNLLVVFGVKTVLTAIPVLCLWTPLVWALALARRGWDAERGRAPGWMVRVAGGAKGWLLDAGWLRGAHGVVDHVAAASGHVAWVVERSLLIAAVIVIFWTLVRLVWPRS